MTLRTPTEPGRPSGATMAQVLGFLYAFFVFGWTESLRGPTLPLVMDDAGLGYAVTGLVMLAGYLGFTSASLVMGLLSDLRGNRRVILLAAGSLAAGILVYSSSRTAGFLFLGMLLVGFGLGSIELGGNAGIAGLRGIRTGRFLNLLGFCHGLASMTVPAIAGFLLGRGMSWRTFYRLDLVLVLALFLLFLLLRLRRPEPVRPDARPRLDLPRLTKTVGSPRMRWFYLLVAAYMSADIALSTWLVAFLRDVRAFSLETASLYLSLYFGAITLGRFLGSFFVDRFPYTAVIALSSAGAAALILLGLFGPAPLAILIPLSGLFYSVVFPTSVGAVSSLHKESAGTALGIYFAFAGLGGMLGSWLIGQVAERWGLTGGFVVIVVLLGIVVLAVSRVSRAHHPEEAPSWTG